MVGLYAQWAKQYPIVSLEDGMGEEDREGWQELTNALGDRLQLVGDDNFVTNPQIFAQGINNGIANAILIKLNQIGTVSETLETVAMARASAESSEAGMPASRAAASQIALAELAETWGTWPADEAVSPLERSSTEMARSVPGDHCLAFVARQSSTG